MTKVENESKGWEFKKWLNWKWIQVVANIENELKRWRKLKMYSRCDKNWKRIQVVIKMNLRGDDIENELKRWRKLKNEFKRW